MSLYKDSCSDFLEFIGVDERIYPTYKVAKFATVLKEQGISVEEFLAGTELTEADIYSNSTRISHRQLIVAYQNAVLLSKHPAIGLLAGNRLGITDYGFYGYALISSATLREALLFSIKYHQLATPTVRMFLHIDDAQDVVSLRMEDRIKIESLYRFNLEVQFGLVFSLFKEMAGTDFRFTEVHAKFPSYQHQRTYEDIFECKILFKQRYNELIFDKKWLDKPSVNANLITAQTTKELCDRTLFEMKTREGLTGDVFRFIVSNIRNNGKEELAASHLNMSARTLRRKLAVEETSFQKILNDARSQIAIDYLTHSKFSIEDIAERLGFSDATNFRHAFKKWTGKNASAYRI